MKQFYLFLSFILMLSANALQAQNDTIYFWKNGTLKLKESIKTADLDSITFKRLVAANPNVTIGTQVWATKNLDVSTYSDGRLIPQVTDAATWAALTTGAWCYINNDSAFGTTYGKLYNWYAVAGIWNEVSKTDESQRKKLAPSGYHVPSEAEWTSLTDYLGGYNVAGEAMREADTAHWFSPNAGATNSSGFTALPGGYRNYPGNFASSRFSGYWWSSSADGTTANAWNRGLYYNSGSVYRSSDSKKIGFSVRCIKD
jgi:uncharacterized protein (TIGR02145 family)